MICKIKKNFPTPNTDWDYSCCNYDMEKKKKSSKHERPYSVYENITLSSKCKYITF